MSAAAETSRRGDADASATARRTASSIPSRYETLPRADTAREGFGSSSYRKFRVGDAPGAGTYHLAGDIAETSTSVGAKGFGALASGASRLTPEDPSLVPGPGQYTARHPESRMRFCRAPSTSPLASSAVDRAPTNPDADAPGPADYHPERPRPRGARRRVRVSLRDPPVRLLRRRGRRRRPVPGILQQPHHPIPHQLRARDRGCIPAPPRAVETVRVERIPRTIPARAASWRTHRRRGRPRVSFGRERPERGHSWRGDEARVRRADGVSKFRHARGETSKGRGKP